MEKRKRSEEMMTQDNGKLAAQSPGSKVKNYLVLLIALLVVLGAIYVGYQPSADPGQQAASSQSQTSPGAVGTKAAKFRSIDIAGNPVDFKSPSEQATWLVFNATWCSSCRAEMPEVKELAARQDMKLLSIYLKESNKQVRPYAEKLALDYPQLGDANGQISESFGVNSVPTHILVDRDGKIVFRKAGPISLAEAEKALKAIQ